MYKFIKIKDPDNKFDVSHIEFTVEAVTLEDILTEFEHFLKASGFIFEGKIEIVEPEESGE